MCGIVGYVGGGAVSEILLAGLKNLEYRGYDSAGIALNDNGRIDVFKAPGKLGNLCAAAAGKADKLPATGGIGHIRWKDMSFLPKPIPKPRCICLNANIKNPGRWKRR